MSTYTSFKKKMPKRMYRERAQPAHRRHFGLLEKKQDWSKRAKYYKQKQEQLNLLRQKADLKNEDEFYFKMQNAEQKKGVVLLKEKDPLNVSFKNSQIGGKSTLYKQMFEEEDDYEFVKDREKKKDLNYIVQSRNQAVIQLKKAQILKKIKRLKAQLQFIGQTDDMRNQWDITQDPKQFRELVGQKPKKAKSMFHETALKKKKVGS